MNKEIVKIIEHKNKFLEYYEKSNDSEIKEMVSHIKKTNHFYMMNCDLSKNYDSYIVEVRCEGEDPYVTWGGHHIYFPLQYIDEIDWRFKALLKEQDVFSPHRYLDDKCYEKIRQAKLEGKRIVVLELGAMEGMFSLTLADIADEIYLFECNTVWAESLKKTFSRVSSNVHIIQKKVGDKSCDETIAVDDMDIDIENSLLILKMDIEGDERLALSGCKSLIKSVSSFIGLVCSYHKCDDEAIIREMFSDDFEIYTNRGYFCFYVSDDYKEPFIRRCVLKIMKS